MSFGHSPRRFLRSPAVIVGEILAFGAAGAAGASWPGLRVFQSPWFFALVILAAASLSVTVLDLARRRRVGSLVFHAGLLLVILAGALRAWFAADAIVDLIEGETLLPKSEAWSAQSPGWLGRPIRLEVPVTLETVSGSRYPGGDLRDLRASFSVGELAVNRQLKIGSSRISLGREFGPALLLEWPLAGREAALLRDVGRGRYEGVSKGPDGYCAYLRANAARPASVEVRVVRGDGLVAVTDLRVGQTLPLPGGMKLMLHGAPMWVRLHGSRDPALWLAYLGFAMVLGGTLLLFVFRPVPACRAVPVPRVAMQPAVVAALLLLLAAAGCRPSSTEEARRLVTRYNDVVSEAYRRGDVKLVDGVVGVEEGKRLTGLIGVRLDLGLTLDSHMLSLEVQGVERNRNELRVRTKERWKYCDRKIGTGAMFGEEGIDSYDMLYVFRKKDSDWLVEEIQFAAPPQVGRKPTTWAMERPKAAQP
jgi:hypothetical protein